jgi:alkylation response protein AidB-like acyl-CoA dehydrogenase
MAGGGSSIMTHPYRLSGTGGGVVATASRIASEIAAPCAADVDTKGRFPVESLKALAEAGLMGLCLAKEAGGKGEGMRAFAGVVEELAGACASTAMVYVMHVSAAQAIASSSTLRGREALLKDMAAGRHLTTLALSEKGSRSQFWAPVSRLEESDGGFVTSAEKSWVTSASSAKSYVASAQKPGAASPMESTIYLARTGVKGMRIAAPFDGLGLRGNDSSAVAFEGLRIAAQDLLTPQGDGAKMMLEVILPWFAIGTAAMANGLCLAAFRRTTDHLVGAGFEHTGTRLRDLPALRARLARMSVRAESSRGLLGRALDEVEGGSQTAPLFVLESRLAALEAAVEVTSMAMQAGGGAAFSKHLTIERLFRDARAGWVMAPTVDHLEEFIGRVLTGLPLF